MLLETQILAHVLTLTLTPLRFVCEATTPLRLEETAYRAENNLRGALGGANCQWRGFIRVIKFCPTLRNPQSAWAGWGYHHTVFTSLEAARVWSQEAFTPTSSRQSDCQ